MFNTANGTPVLTFLASASNSLLNQDAICSIHPGQNRMFCAALPIVCYGNSCGPGVPLISHVCLNTVRKNPSRLFLATEPCLLYINYTKEIKAHGLNQPHAVRFSRMQIQFDPPTMALPCHCIKIASDSGHDRNQKIFYFLSKCYTQYPPRAK